MILYASPTGTANTQCSRQMPCSLSHSIATAESVRSTVRLLEGQYVDSYVVMGKPLTIVGNPDTIIGNGAQTTLAVYNGASVVVRGVRFEHTNGELLCNSTTTRSALRLDRVAIRNIRLDVGMCDAVVRESSTFFESQGNAMAREGGKLSIERSQFRSGPSALAGYISAGVNGSEVTAVNSTFENVVVTVGSNASVLKLAFNTFVDRNPEPGFGAIECTNALDTPPIIENNIMFSDENAIYGASCANVARYNVLFPQTQTVPATNIIMDPLLADPASGNFKLRAGSPAIDAAMPSAGLSPATDIEGTMRPQGARHDIGAFEHAP